MSHTSTAAQTGSPLASLAMLNVDCADPTEPARFWAAALGWTVSYSEATYGVIEGNGGDPGGRPFCLSPRPTSSA